MLTATSKERTSILRLTPIVLGSILLFSLADFGLAIAYANQLYSAPLDPSKWDYSKDKPKSIAWFALYSGFFPFLSFTHATIDAVSFFFAQLNPICTLTFSLILFVGWIIQLSFWCHCDYSPDPDLCYQFYVVENPMSEMTSSLNGVSDEVTAAKAAVGMIMLVFYVAYLVMAATAVQEIRRSGHVRIDNNEELGLENRYSMGHGRRPNSDHLQSLLL